MTYPASQWKMRRQFVIISILVCLAVALQGVKWIFFPHVLGYAAYGFNSLILIMLIAPGVLALNLLYLSQIKHRRPVITASDSNRFNRRRSYRVTYPNKYRPRLIIDQTDRLLRRELEFAVIDLSQDGACFNDNGSLGPAGSISGCIKLDNEKSLPISGKVVRLKGSQVCVRFFHPIAWTVLLEEQRRLLQIQPVGGV